MPWPQPWQGSRLSGSLEMEMTTSSCFCSAVRLCGLGGAAGEQGRAGEQGQRKRKYSFFHICFFLLFCCLLSSLLVYLTVLHRASPLGGYKLFQVLLPFCTPDLLSCDEGIGHKTGSSRLSPWRSTAVI